VDSPQHPHSRRGSNLGRRPPTTGGLRTNGREVSPSGLKRSREVSSWWLNSSPTIQALALEMPSGIAIATIDPRLDRCEVQAGKGVLAPLSMGLPLSPRLLAELLDELCSIR
jgi:hypothetical protein